MSAKLSQSQKLLHDSLFELYIHGGLDIYLAGTRGLKRELTIDLETSALTPEKGEIIHFYACDPFKASVEFDEWARPSKPLSPEAEQILGITNAELAPCRATASVLEAFMCFIDSSYPSSADWTFKGPSL